MLLVHNVCLTQSDIDAAKKAFEHVFFALCPLSNIFIHNTLPHVELMWKNGLDITVGTDSLSSNDDLDIISELACLHENFPSIPMVEIFRWASLNGARFLKKDDSLGSFAEGKRPGIVIVDGITEDGCITSSSCSKRLI